MTPTGKLRVGRALGLVLQSVLLGTLLAAAVAHVILTAPGAAVFRYEAY